MAPSAPLQWRLLDADERERSLFPDLPAVLRRAGELAGPRNRLREVRRVEADGRCWYLKVFHRIQPKNALRLRLTAPRARTEAEREAAMARALRLCGQEAPRPVAVGRHGASSYFLCAALAGRPLRAALDECLRADLLLAAARTAGRLARTFSLPDTSAEHVWVARGSAQGKQEFAVLDLHNAHLGAASRRTLRRILRHGARSLRGLPLQPRAALRAALAFLRAAGCTRPARRRTLAALAPWTTHERYERPGKNEAYRARDPRRSARELRLLERVWPGVRGELVLDTPCGGGRLFPFLHEHGHRLLGADRARAMLRVAADQALATLLAAEAARLPVAEASVDGVLLFRFLHHLDARDARAAIAEAARVARRWIVVSVFHPRSAHALWRGARALVTGRARTRHALAPRTLDGWLAQAGFVPVARAREGPLRDLCVLSYRRRE